MCCIVHGVAEGQTPLTDFHLTASLISAVNSQEELCSTQRLRDPGSKELCHFLHVAFPKVTLVSTSSRQMLGRRKQGVHTGGFYEPALEVASLTSTLNPVACTQHMVPPNCEGCKELPSSRMPGRKRDRLGQPPALLSRLYGGQMAQSMGRAHSQQPCVALLRTSASSAACAGFASLVCITPWCAAASCLVAKSCPALCDLMNCSMSGSSVLHCLPEFAETHVH